ncbi:hypothetical protein D9758_002426 [Tetrapyrgos nigripes]|uniref:Peptidase S26 domain-containing protein n=1 Tax=Tetrapyrgos nigripes TaxID=182062 RepID=A0A8H5GNI8_9AGAR|nr:hypothetical protein D9758_002426 [Tetrapyrgos nigripes]
MSRWITNALEALKDRNAVKGGLKRAGIRGFKIINMFCAIHLFTEYVGRPSTMAGPSMLPTLATHGEIVIEDRITYRLNPSSLSRGELITLKSPVNPSHIVCKRVHWSTW